MSLPKVFVTRSDYSDSGIKLLRERFNVDCYPHPKCAPQQYLLEHIKGASALFCTSIDHVSEQVLDTAGPQLKIIATMSLGYEHIDIEACKKRNIQVTNVANPLYVSVVAEFTVSLLLTVSRRLVEADAFIRNGEWNKSWTLDMLVGRGIINSTVGIIGMGRIGQAVLERIVSFHPAKVLYYDVVHPINKAESLGARFSNFDDLLKVSDYVIVNCNLTDQNRGMFDTRAFSLMKPTAVFINTSRGGVVDQDALINALKTKQIKAAGIDVMYPEPLPENHELLSLPNLVITPHIAAAEELALAKNSSLTAENIIEVLEGRKPLTSIFDA